MAAFVLGILRCFPVQRCQEPGAFSVRPTWCRMYRLQVSGVRIAVPLEVPGSPWSEPPGGFRHAGIGVQLDPQQSELIVCYRADRADPVLGPKTRGLAVSSEPCQVRGRTAGLQEAALEEARLPLESARSAACAASPSSVQGRGSEVRDRRGMAQGSGPHSDC